MLSSPAHILLVEDNSDIADMVARLLIHEGYSVTKAASLPEALDLLDHHIFDLVLTDLFGSHAAEGLRAIQPLIESACPTPIAVATAHRFSSDQDLSPFCFTLLKPFDLDELLVGVAEIVGDRLLPLNPCDTQLLMQYYACLAKQDWDEILRLCDDKIEYVLPSSSLSSRTIQGKADFHLLAIDTFARFPGASFDTLRLYARPHGIAARYLFHWQAPDGTTMQQSMAALFEVSQGHIRHIGVRTNLARMRGDRDR